MTIAFAPPASTTGNTGGPVSDRINADLVHAVVDADNNSGRSLQVSIGPSEIGDPCARRIAHRLMGTPTINTARDPWPAIVGTATHAWLADALLRQNTPGQTPVWLVEQRVPINASISGHGDAYHVPTGSVVDHKVVGATSMRKYKTSGPGSRYRTQIHLYGMGWENLGIPVNTVTLAFWSRSGWLRDLWVWSEPYQRQVAQDAMNRLGALSALAYDLQLDRPGGRWDLVPSDTHDCSFCPFWRPGKPADDTGCPGHTP